MPINFVLQDWTGTSVTASVNPGNETPANLVSEAARLKPCVSERAGVEALGATSVPEHRSDSAEPARGPRAVTDNSSVCELQRRARRDRVETLT